MKTVRNSIKIILLNKDNKILLMSTDDKTIKSVDGNYKGKFWQLIGGKIEPSETLIEASKRELFEETGLTDKDVHFEKVVWEGNLSLYIKDEITFIHQRFIVAKTKNDNVTLKYLTKEEKSVVKMLKWMSLEDIKNSKELIYPSVLKNYLPDILNGNYPDKIIKIKLQEDSKVSKRGV